MEITIELKQERIYDIDINVYIGWCKMKGVDPDAEETRIDYLLSSYIDGDEHPDFSDPYSYEIVDEEYRSSEIALTSEERRIYEKEVRAEKIKRLNSIVV